jgi:hypothetical protein
MFFLSLGAAT